MTACLGEGGGTSYGERAASHEERAASHGERRKKEGDIWQIATNTVYLYPAWEAWKRGWWGPAIVYLGTGMVSAVYHSAVEGGWEDQSAWQRIDWLWAITYLIVSVVIWWVYVCAKGGWAMGEAILWCLFSLAVFWMDRETEEHGGAHMAWHLLTGVGVGRMVSGVMDAGDA